MTVPAGAYAVTANTIMTAFTGTSDIIEALLGTNGSVGGTCILDFGGVQASSLETIAIINRQTPATFGMQLTRTVAAPTEIVLKCAASLAVARVGVVDHRDEGRLDHHQTVEK